MCEYGFMEAWCEYGNFEDISSPFQKCVPYMEWLCNYRELMKEYPSNECRNFGKYWLKKEISNFLSSIVFKQSYSYFVVSQVRGKPFLLKFVKIK